MKLKLPIRLKLMTLQEIFLATHTKTPRKTVNNKSRKKYLGIYNDVKNWIDINNLKLFWGI